MEEERGPFAIYSRKSKFTGKGESIENQIELCRQYISANFGKEYAKDALIFEDEGFSGGNLERPKFKLMMQEARKKKFSAIVCYRLDRISRNIGDFAKLIEELNQLHISFISIKEQFDTSSPMGRAMMYIASVFSQLERETIAERIRDNMLELSKSGRWLGGNTPTGYKSESVSTITVEGKIKKAYKLALIPEEACLIRLIFEKFIETGSLTGTETYLIQNGSRTRTGRLFSRFAIKGILTNPVYMMADVEAYDYLRKKKVDLFAEKSEFTGKYGVIAYNRTLQKPGKSHEVRDMGEWIIAVGKHEGIIPGSMWVRVQSLLEQNKSKNYRKPRSHVALMSGVLYCGNCGSYMRPKLSGRCNEQGEQMYSYLCSLKEKSRMKCCAMKNANGNAIDAMVMEEIKKIQEDKTEFQKKLSQNKRTLEEDRQEFQQEMERMEDEIQDMDKQIEGLVSSLSLARGLSAENYIIRQIEELHRKKEELELQIRGIESQALKKELSELELEAMKQLLSSFYDTLGETNIQQKRAAIRGLVKKAVWDGKNLHVYLNGANEPLRESSK